MIVAIEGIDGSGKGTQALLLSNKLKSKFENVELISFPRYGRSKGAALVEDYLNGRLCRETHEIFGPAMFFAIDRFEAQPLIRAFAGESNRCLIIDRYVASNIAHQSSKQRDSNLRNDCQRDIFRIEHHVFEMPLPDITFFFDIDPGLAQERILKKAPRSYTNAKQDVHESDLEHLSLTAKSYREIEAKNLYEKFHRLEISQTDDPADIESRILRTLSETF